RPGSDVLDQFRAAGRAIALPQFGTVGAVVGHEVGGAVDVGDRLGIGIAEGADVRHHRGAGSATIARPELAAVGAVVGKEVELAVEGRQIRLEAQAATAAGNDVGDHLGGRAVAGPQLDAGVGKRGPVVGGEVEVAVEGGEITDLDGACGRHRPEVMHDL